MTRSARVAPLVKRLLDFSNEPAMAAFRGEACEAFLGAGRPPTKEGLEALQGFILFGFRDKEGRGTVDLFLLHHGHELQEKEKYAFNKLNGAVYGFFEVKKSTPGTGLRAKLCGSSKHFDVVDVDASRRLRPGEGFTAWLLPYRRHHEIAGKLLSYSRPFMVILHRLTQWDDSLRQQISSSIEVNRIEEAARTEGAPTLKKREAKLFAKKVFGEVRFPLSVEDLERGLKSPEDLEEMLSRAKFTGLKPKESASQLLRAILLLGLHSSREAPGNLTTRCARLPPPGIRAWPAEELRRKIAEAFSAGKKSSLSWLLRELASRGERLPADALQVLLDDPSNKRLAHFLISLEVPPLSEAAEQIALAIAERMPRYRKRSSALCERVLAALASLGPARHLGVFCEALRDPLLSIRRFGLVGLMEARRPESEPVLLEFLRTNENLGNSVNALSALLGSGSETAITEAASRVIDLATVRGDDFDDEYGGSGLGELGISPAVPGLGFDLYVRVGKALLAKKSFSSIPPGPDPTLSVFRPKADPRASRRAKAVLTGKRKEELLDLAEAEDLPRLDTLLVELALEAIERASLDQPGFLPLGRRLSSFLRGSADCGLFEMLSLENRMDLVLLHGMVLAKAIRGRDVEAEFEEASQSRAGILELLRLDERWLTVNRLREVAAKVQVRDLIELAESPDLQVAKNCALLLAALDPKKYLESALDAFTLGEEEDDLIGEGLAVVAGEACCEPFLQSCALLEEDTRFQLLADVFCRVGTLRARYYLERWFDRLKLIPPDNLLDMALSLGDRNLAIRSLRRLRDWGWDAGDSVGREWLVERIRLLVELHGLPAEEGKVVAENLKDCCESPRKKAEWAESLGLSTDEVDLIDTIGDDLENDSPGEEEGFQDDGESEEP